MIEANLEAPTEGQTLEGAMREYLEGLQSAQAGAAEVYRITEDMAYAAIIEYLGTDEGVEQLENTGFPTADSPHKCFNSLYGGEGTRMTHEGVTIETIPVRYRFSAPEGSWPDLNEPDESGSYPTVASCPNGVRIFWIYDRKYFEVLVPIPKVTNSVVEQSKPAEGQVETASVQEAVGNVLR